MGAGHGEIAGRWAPRGDVLCLAEEACRVDTPKMRRLRQLEEENGKLKKLVADLSLDEARLHDVLAKMYDLPRPGKGLVVLTTAVRLNCMSLDLI
jgi:hypothetical protein